MISHLVLELANLSKLMMLFTVMAVSFALVSHSTEAFAQTAPAPPTNLQANPVSATKIDLVWKASSNNGTKPVTGYKIEVKTPPADFTALVANTGNTTLKYSHTVTTGKTYVYRVSAISQDGTSTPSPEALAKTSSTLTVTNPPGNLTAAATGPTKIELSWISPPSYGGPPVTGYKIERKAGTSSGFSPLVSGTNSTSTKYTDSTVLTNTQYTYRVSAINSIGPSGASNEATATPTSQSAPPKIIPKNQTATNTSTKTITDPIAAAKAEMQKKIDEARKSIPKKPGQEDSAKAKAARDEAIQANEKAKRDALAARQKLVAEKQAAIKEQQEKPSNQTAKQKPEEPVTKKPKTMEEARKLAEEAKQKALEKANLNTTKSKKDTNKQQQVMDAAKAAVWEKAKKALEEAKKSQK